MDFEKLLRCQDEFLERYPGGMAHPDMLAIIKKHKVPQMIAKARQFCSPEALDEPLLAASNIVRLVTSSSLISVFEKPQFRDFVADLPGEGKIELVQALRQRLWGKEPGDAEKGFNRLRDLLALGKLAKWSLLTVIPVYIDGQNEVLIKPTTVKGVIGTFDLPLIYSPKPSWAFYEAYRAILLEMRSRCVPEVGDDNPSFSGFLMNFIQE